MIIVNYHRDEDYNPDTDGYNLHLAAIVNDTLDLNDDIDKIIECIDNHNYDFKNGVMYEIYLDRAVIRYSHPAREYCFAVTNVEQFGYNETEGHHKPFIDLS